MDKLELMYKVIESILKDIFQVMGYGMLKQGYGFQSNKAATR